MQVLRREDRGPRTGDSTLDAVRSVASILTLAWAEPDTYDLLSYALSTTSSIGAAQVPWVNRIGQRRFVDRGGVSSFSSD